MMDSVLILLASVGVMVFSILFSYGVLDAIQADGIVYTYLWGVIGCSFLLTIFEKLSK